jgi:hypothetical protein
LTNTDCRPRLYLRRLDERLYVRRLDEHRLDEHRLAAPAFTNADCRPASLQPAFDKLSRLVTSAESFYVLSQLLEGVETEMMARAGDTTSHARKVTETVAGVVSTLEIDNRQKDIRQRPFYEK